MAILAGCQNTGEGVKQDATNMQKEANRAGDNISEGTRDTMAATTLTPKIKSAIIANPLLNDPKNTIDVDATEESVTLTGHVATQELKDTAGRLAQQILDESNAKQALHNDLTIQP